jgi:hypothetical protein
MWIGARSNRPSPEVAPLRAQLNGDFVVVIDRVFAKLDVIPNETHSRYPLDRSQRTSAPTGVRTPIRCRQHRAQFGASNAVTASLPGHGHISKCSSTLRHGLASNVGVPRSDRLNGPLESPDAIRRRGLML